MNPIDVGRAGAALAAPGMDTRAWVLKAICIGSPFMDPTAGYLVRVMLMPSGEEATAAVCVDYAGAGFGSFRPLAKDDMVLVGNPGGMPDEGWYVIGRCWQRSDPPPAELPESPTHLLDLAESNRNHTIATQGTGNVIVDARGTGKVLLGTGTVGHETTIKADTYRTAEDLMLAALSAAVALIVKIPGLTLPEQGLVTTATAAITTFMNAAATYKTTSTKVK